MKRITTILLAAALSSAAYAADRPAPTRANTQGLTQEQGTAILEELKQIRLLLEKQGAAPAAAPAQAGPNVKVTLGDGPMLGAKDAPITMVEFTDYQCPFCQQFHTATFGEIRRKFIDTGKVRFVSRDLPLDMHPNAPRAAEAARCAGEQGQYWKLRDMMIANPGKLSLDDIQGYARSLYLDIAPFKSCMDSAKYKSAVQQDSSLAAALNISGTPTFVIGKTTDAGVEGEIFVGAHPIEAFEAKIAEFQAR